MTTPTAERSGQSTLGDRPVNRLGYGAMQLAGPHVMGPPADRGAAITVLRRAVELGVDHIDTSDYYARTWPTRSSGRRCTPTPRTSPS
jgi:pyridoxine 4-dehydrogenase